MAATVLAVSMFCLSFLPNKIVKYCGKEYIEKKTNEYLKDEKIETISVGVYDKKTKKPVFGYIVSAIRNDTNFIYTRFSYMGDTILRKVYYDYKISRGKDSVISKFICKQNKLYFYSLETYWNGELKRSEFPNYVLGE
ncbi:MAG: hypothetical protein EOO53_20550 [Gammaproteobacteria bacterium]|nr:MAG: hypothetical protein EOO53_20550 [Gammaproteobacteria bacterium]